MCTGGTVHFVHTLPFSFDLTMVSNANRFHAPQSVNLTAASILFWWCSLENFICFETFSCTNSKFVLLSILHWHYMCHRLRIIIAVHQFCSCLRTLGKTLQCAKTATISLSNLMFSFHPILHHIPQSSCVSLHLLFNMSPHVMNLSRVLVSRLCSIQQYQPQLGDVSLWRRTLHPITRRQL